MITAFVMNKLISLEYMVVWNCSCICMKFQKVCIYTLIPFTKQQQNHEKTTTEATKLYRCLLAFGSFLNLYVYKFCVQVIEKWLNIEVDKILRIITFPQVCLQMKSKIDSK